MVYDIFCTLFLKYKFKHTVKPVLTGTSIKRAPAHNGRPRFLPMQFPIYSPSIQRALYNAGSGHPILTQNAPKTS